MKAKYPLWIAAAIAALAMLLLGNGAGTTDATVQERRIAEVLSTMEGVGSVEVALYFKGDYAAVGQPTGAVVVAEGAHDLSVRLNLIRAMRTLLGLNEAAVDVFAMEAE